MEQRNTSDIQKALQLSAHAVRSGDVLATKMGLPPCISCVYPEWMPDGIITADMIRVSPNPKTVDANWLAAAINHDRVKRQVAMISAGVTRAKVTLFDFRSIKVATPGLAEQREISEQFRLIARQIESALLRVEKLQLQKFGLLQDLLTGKVQVKSRPPETEPA